VSQVLKVGRFRKRGGCRWCAGSPGLLFLLLWRGRRHGWRSCLCCLLAIVAGLLGLGTLVWLYLRWRERPHGRSDGRTDGPVTAGTPGRPATGEKQTIPGTIYRRPDPMIYDQYYLMSQGLAVTWDNPDIHLERPLGTPVSSHDLLPDTRYHVIARIWNLSVKAPAVHMPVEVSYLSFGIGTTKTTFAQTQVDLPVKGSAGLPARAEVEWRTPPDPGHYCLQVELLWPKVEDENPDNNLGQHNTVVQALHSPARFEFPVRNDDLSRRRDIRLVADMYRIPPLRSCDERGEREGAAARHERARFPVPEGWRVEMEPSSLRLAPDQEEQVSVTVTAPDGFAGRRAVNVNAFDGERLVGGVTLYVDG
jgi:hypothetical protein